MKKILLLILCTGALASCSRNMNSNTYTDSNTPGKVLEGTIINARTVTIKAHDKLQDNTLGGVAGGAAGLGAGSLVGNGSGNIAADIGGALVGAVAGAYIEDALGTQDGMEYLVKLDKKYIQDYDATTRKIQAKAGSPVEQDMINATNVGTKTDIVSVVQVADASLHEGVHVYIIYNDDRPRLVAEK